MQFEVCCTVIYKSVLRKDFLKNFFLFEMVGEKQTPIFEDACENTLNKHTLGSMFMKFLVNNLVQYMHCLTAHIWQIGNIFYPCSFTVLDAPNMEFLFGLDMLRKHQVLAWVIFGPGHASDMVVPHAFHGPMQCMIDLKDNVLRVGGGEVSVPFLQGKWIIIGYHCTVYSTVYCKTMFTGKL
jgi:hypothetical protein